MAQMTRKELTKRAASLLAKAKRLETRIVNYEDTSWRGRGPLREMVHTKAMYMTMRSETLEIRDNSHLELA